MNALALPRHVAACVLVLPLLASTGCDIVTAEMRETAREQWQRTYDLAPGGTLTLDNVNGRIVVEPAEGRQVQVTAEKIARGASTDAAKEALARTVIEETSSPTSVQIVTRTPRTNGFFGNSAEVRYAVRVPSGVNVRFKTVNGGVELTGLSGTLEATTTNGGITARDLSGNLEASTTNGGIDVDMASLGERGATLRTVNGGIRLRVPAGTRADLRASVTNGGIHTEGFTLDTMTSSRRKLEGRINGGGPPVTLSGTNGGITLRAR